ncbi:MAG: agmatinase [Candidatus Abyssobacteria bacterium SURF_17]|uniref:Agmatinase n=1 Tax=Candidatus Abyssobacteria bacterium SURF_17 TaxID=2093361 RepID=A0A419EW22_9BACT|nr:MAG: agmatinase [Candidatus Abyssubacteria bacterium SURF_17]
MTHTKKRIRDSWFSAEHNFGGLSAKLSAVETSAIVLLPVPYEASTTYRAGCRHGPSAIIEASTNMELYDEELCFEPCAAGIHTVRPLDVVDDAGEMLKRICTVATTHVERGKFVTLLGGEHTVSLGIVRALRAAHKDLSVLILDAHADYRESYRGNEYSHACVSRRIAEDCNLVLAGVRSLSREEADSLKASNTIFYSHQFRAVRGKTEQKALIERVVERLGPKVHISIDVDVFDPSIMPAVGTPEPGGLLWDEVLDMLRAVITQREVVGLDLVELAPVAGLSHPEFMAAKLLYRTWGYLLKSSCGKR